MRWMSHARAAACLPLLAAALLAAAAAEAEGTRPLDLVIVMDNSDAMVAADRDYLSVAAAGLLVDLLRPEDRAYVVSCGAAAAVVMSGGGSEKEKLAASIGLMKRESTANDPADALRAVDELLGSLAKEGGAGGEGRTALVVWFMAPELRFNARDKGYAADEKLEPLFKKAADEPLWNKSPFKKKEVLDLHREIFPAASARALAHAARIGERGARVALFVLGKGVSAPGVPGDAAADLVAGIAKAAGGSVGWLAPGGDAPPLAGLLSLFVRTLMTPTVTVAGASVGAKGESFDVYRKSGYLWVVILFSGAPPRKVQLTMQDPASDKTRKWPFGKKDEDVLVVKPELRRGEVFEQRRWYASPGEPAGYGLLAVRNPTEGVYKLQLEAQKGDTVEVRVLQDIELEFGFFTKPPGSIPLGADFSAVAGLRSRDGVSYSLDRTFLADLKFEVRMVKEGGGVPAWGESKQAQFSKEGEVMMGFQPASRGVYYVEGEVSHRAGEFAARLAPWRVEVFPRVDLSFEGATLAWSGPAGEGWVELRPPLRLLPGAEVPEDFAFELAMDWSKVSNAGLLEVRPGKALAVVVGKREYPILVRYRDPASLRRDGMHFEGPLYLEVSEEQRKNIEGTGAWAFEVKGAATPWTVAMYAAEYRLALHGGIALALLLLLLLERRLRPALGAGFTLHTVTRLPSGREIAAAAAPAPARAPLLPFRRRRVVVTAAQPPGGARVQPPLCALVPRRRGVQVVPLAGPVVFTRGGETVRAAAPFAASEGERYVVRGGETEVEFWFATGREG